MSDINQNEFIIVSEETVGRVPSNESFDEKSSDFNFASENGHINVLYWFKKI